MRRYFRKNIKPTTEKKKISASDILAFIGIVLTFAFGYWGAKLSELSMQQSKEISGQQQQIKGFDSLLQLTKSEILILSKQDSILISQLIISNDFLAYQKNNIKLSYKSNLANLMNSENELKLLLWQPHSHSNTLIEWSYNERDSLVNKAKQILQSQLSNTFLIQNTKLYSKWVASFDSLTEYTSAKQFYPKNKKEFLIWDKPFSNIELQINKELIDKCWRSGYISISKLWQDLYNFLNQYRFGKFNFDK